MYRAISYIMLLCVLFLTSCTDGSGFATQTTVEDTEMVQNIRGEGIYLQLRDSAMNCQAEQIGLSNLRDDQIFGMIVDIAVDGTNTATMVFFAEGSTSVYFSTGGVVIGAGQHQGVKAAADAFLLEADQVLPYLVKATRTNTMPKENHYIFYLKTINGIFTADIDTTKSNLSDVEKFLFYNAQTLLEEIRKAEETASTE